MQTGQKDIIFFVFTWFFFTEGIAITKFPVYYSKVYLIHLTAHI